MRTTKLTITGKLAIFFLVLVVAGAATYFAGGFDALSKIGKKDDTKVTTSNSTNNSSKSDTPKGDQVKTSNVIDVSLDEWIGWKSIIDANGGLTTKAGSIYDKLGIKVNIHIINDATQSSNALIKGELDATGYTVNRYAFLLPKFKSANTEVVMPYITNFSTGGDGIIAKADIKGIEGLVGKKIGVPRYSEAQTLIWWLLEKSSLTQEQIAQIQKDMVMFDTPDDAAKAFFAGQVDAAATWQPYLSQAQETTGAKLLFSTKSANNIILDGVVFNKKFYDANKDTVSKFIQGSLDAKELYTTQFTAIKDTMPLFATESDENIKAMSGDATLATYSDNVKLLDDTAKTLFKDMSNIWKTVGEQSNPEDVDKVFDSSVIKTLSDKYGSELPVNTPKVTEEQRNTAQTQDNTQALLKKSTTINFQPNSAAFVDATEAAKALDEFVQIAKILDGAIIQIEGNIASDKPDAAGVKLSEQRAKTVAVYLQQQGVDPSRFVIIGNGANKPLAKNDTEENKKKNRRTDIFFKLVE